MAGVRCGEGHHRCSDWTDTGEEPSALADEFLMARHVNCVYARASPAPFPKVTR